MITKFCCCFDLRKGLIVYGVISWILGILYLIFAANFVVYLNGEINKNNRDFDLNDYSMNPDDLYENVIIFCVIIGLITTIISFLLVFGAYKKSRGYLLAYLILNGIPLSLVSIGVFIGFIFSQVVIACAPGIALNWYFWFCVLHYRESLTDGAVLKPQNNMILHLNKEVPYSPMNA